MRIGVIVTAGVGACLLAACGGGSDVTTGAIPAGASPGIVTNSPVGAGAGEPQVGAIEGGLMGTDVGRSLDDADRALALKAEYEALEYVRTGPIEWHSEDGQNRGQIYVGGTYQVNRLDCRSYTHNIWIGGRLRVVTGTACREPDGVWRIVG